MDIHELKPAKGSTAKRHRVGRGHGSGWVKTSGKGGKGQTARSGGGKGSHFEGGQTPWYRRLPKLKGFKNFLFKVEYQEVPLYKLNRFDEGVSVDAGLLWENGLIRKQEKPIKVLGNGELTRKLSVKAHAFSKSAEEKIKAKGGTVEVVQ